MKKTPSKTPLAQLVSQANKGISVVLATSLIASMTVTGCALKTDTETKQEPEPLKVVSYMVLGAGHGVTGVPSDNTSSNPAGYQPKPTIRTLSGQVVAAQSSKVSFESSGKIKSMFVKVGSHVTKGEVLAEIDDINYQLQLSQAQAKLHQSQAQYSQAQSRLHQSQAQLNQATDQRDKAKIDVKRREALIPIGAVSRTEIDAVQLALRTAENQVNVANDQIRVAQEQITMSQDQVRAAAASVELLKKQFRDTRLTAPFEGVITQQFAEVGQLASPSVPVFTIDSEDKKEVRISVPETLLNSVGIGQPMLVHIPAIGQQAKGKVTEISNQAVAGSFPVTIRLLNDSRHVKPGMTAEVAFQVVTAEMIRMAQASHHLDNAIDAGAIQSAQVATNHSFKLPPSAVGASDDPNDATSDYVYRIVNDGDKNTLERVSVKIVDLSGGSMDIVGDLQAGDKVVRTGVSLLNDKQQVALMGVGAKRVNP